MIIKCENIYGRGKFKKNVLQANTVQKDQNRVCVDRQTLKFRQTVAVKHTGHYKTAKFRTLKKISLST